MAFAAWAALRFSYVPERHSLRHMLFKQFFASVSRFVLDDGGVDSGNAASDPKKESVSKSSSGRALCATTVLIRVPDFLRISSGAVDSVGSSPSINADGSPNFLNSSAVASREVDALSTLQTIYIN